MAKVHALPRIAHSPRDFVKAALVLGILGPLVVGGAGAAAFFLFPLPAIVPDPVPGAIAATSHVLAADGTEIATFHAEHNRELIKLRDMPIHLQQAVIASEDARFFKHSGLDLRAIGRALLSDVRGGRTLQGGSTITQQYVKNAYIDAPQRTIPSNVVAPGYCSPH